MNILTPENYPLYGMEGINEDIIQTLYCTCDEAGKGPVDPTSDNYHGQDIGECSLHHLKRHVRVCSGQGVGPQLRLGQHLH